MMQYYIGIDSGSTMCKAILFDSKNNTVVDFQSVKASWNPELSATECLEYLLERNTLGLGDVCVSSTGYGREVIDFAEHTLTEITCHGFGAMYLLPSIGGVIDIGGQDSKVIQINGGRVVDFLMNDKCAAGTGRFLSMACDTLGINLDDIDTFAHPNEAITINSMCTVFAESKIIGSLAMQKDRAKILMGVLQSIAQKIHQMAGKFDFDKNSPLLMTGGLSRSNILVKTISKAIGHDVITHEYAAFAGAIGACICAVNKDKQSN